MALYLVTSETGAQRTLEAGSLVDAVHDVTFKHGWFVRTVEQVSEPAAPVDTPGSAQSRDVYAVRDEAGRTLTVRADRLSDVTEYVGRKRRLKIASVERVAETVEPDLVLKPRLAGYARTAELSPRDRIVFRLGRVFVMIAMTIVAIHLIGLAKMVIDFLMSLTG